MNLGNPSSEEIRRMLTRLPNEQDARAATVRIDGRGLTTLSIRGPGKVPRVYAATQTELVALDPAQDDRLPGSRLVADHKTLERRLGLQRHSLREFTLVAYRPGKRIVARIDTGPDGGVLYLKFLSKHGYRRAEAALAAIAETGAGVSLVLPCGWLKKERILVAEEARGPSLFELLQAGEPIDLDLLVRAIRSFSRLGASASLPSHSLEDDRASALKALERGARVLPEIEELHGLVRGLALPDASGRSLLHTDLHDKQIFIDGSSVRFIDLEGIERGDWRTDVVNLSEQLRLRSLQWRTTEGLADLPDALLRSFDLDPNDPFVRVMCGLVRSRLAGVYALRPRWIMLSRELASAARSALTWSRSGTS